MSTRRCIRCHTALTIASVVCPSCLSRDFEIVEAPSHGRLLSWTTIRRAPAGYPVSAPYDVVVVELAPGVRVTGRLSGDSPRPMTNVQVRRVAVEGDCAIFAVVAG